MSTSGPPSTPPPSPTGPQPAVNVMAKQAQLVRSGGQLILTSPYTWLKEFTSVPNWLGGYERDGKRFTRLPGADDDRIELSSAHDTSLGPGRTRLAFLTADRPSFGSV